MSASTDEKQLADVSAERNDLFMLVMALAKKLGSGYTVGVKDADTEWPILFVDDPSGEQISVHVAHNEIESVLLSHKYPYVWNGHTSADKHISIRKIVKAEFSK